MSMALIPILADSIREYVELSDLQFFCEMFNVPLPWDLSSDRPHYVRLAAELILRMEHGNNRLLLETLLPTLFNRNSEMISSTKYERRDYHRQLGTSLEQLKPLLEITTAPSQIAIADAKPFTAKSAIRDLLATAETEVFLVDNYVGVRTLDVFRDVTQPIRILTGQQAQSVESGFENAVKDFRAEGRTIDVRRHPKLHDRYLSFNDRCWLVGGSIKDAGKKALNVIECVDSKTAIVADAEAKWAAGTPYAT